MVVFPSHFNLNNSLLKLLQISVLTRQNPALEEIKLVAYWKKFRLGYCSFFALFLTIFPTRSLGLSCLRMRKSFSLRWIEVEKTL